MAEHKRFFRLVVPGTFAIFWSVILCLLVDYTATEKVLKDLAGGLDAAVAAAVIGLGIAAVLGFLLSTIHHSIIWHFPWLYATDHGPFLRAAIEKKLLKIVLRDGETLQWMARRGCCKRERRTVSATQAWRIVCILWHQRMDGRGSDPNGPLIPSTLNERQASLGDLAHGQGTCLVGLLFSLIPPLVLLPVAPLWPKWLALMGVELVVLLLMFLNTRRLMANAYRVAESVLWQVLKQERDRKEGRTAEVVVSRSELGLRDEDQKSPPSQAEKRE